MRILIIAFLIFSAASSLQAVEKDLTASWDVYTDTTATSLKLYQNSIPGFEGAITIDHYIDPNSTSLEFTIMAFPGDTLWFGLEAVNRNQDPIFVSGVSEWVPWVFLLPTPKPPVPPEGLKITITFELLEP